MDESHTSRTDRGMSSNTQADLSKRMEELQCEMREMRRNMVGVRRSSGLRRGNLFSDEVMTDELPTNFRSLTYEYDGTTDPWEQLCKFENSTLLHHYSDGDEVLVFLTRLTKLAHQWYGQLSANTIRSFKDFSNLFLHQFASTRKHQKTTLDLFSLKHKENEGVRSYMKRFTSTALDILSAT